MKKKILVTAGCIATPALVGYAAYWYISLRHIEKTDNAYVKADMILISPKVNGYVAEVAVHDNEAVKAGQRLIRIGNADYTAKVEQLNAARRSQEAALRTLTLQKALQRSQIAQAEAVLLAAIAQSEKAAADYRRDEMLIKNGFATKEQLERSRSTAAVGAATEARARAELQAARDQLAVSNGKEQQLRADLEQSTAAAKVGMLDLQDTVVVAPAEGIVGNRNVEVGQYVKAGSQIMEVVPANKVYVVANFKETQIRGMRPGQKAEISVDAFPGALIEGMIDSVAPATGSEFSFLPAENATGNFTKIVQRVPVKIAIRPGQALSRSFKPGMSVSVAVNTGIQDSGAMRTARADTAPLQ